MRALGSSVETQAPQALRTFWETEAFLLGHSAPGRKGPTTISVSPDFRER